MSFTRQVVGGTSLIAISNLLGKALGFLTVPILSHLLGTEAYGVAALVAATVAIGSILALVGIDLAYARFYLMNAPDQRAGVEHFCWRFAISGGAIMATLMFLIWHWFGERWSDEHRALSVLTAIVIFCSVVSTMATTRVRLAGNFKRIAVVQFLAAGVACLATISLALVGLKSFWPIVLGPLIMALVTVSLLGTPSIRSLLTPRVDQGFEKKAILMLGFAGSITAPMYWLISSVDRWFIFKYWDASQVGVYSVAGSIALIGIALNSSLTLTWFPEISRLYGEKGKNALSEIGRLWSRAVVGMVVIWLAITASGGDLLRLLAAPDFHSGAVFIPWLAGGVFFYGMSSLANTSLFLDGRMKYSAFMWLLGSAVCIMLNFLLVPWLGAFGASLCQCSSYLLIALSLMAVAQKILPLEIEWTKLLLVGGLAIALGIALAPAWSDIPLKSLLVKFPIGVLAALVMLGIIAPDWIRLIFERLNEMLTTFFRRQPE